MNEHWIYMWTCSMYFVACVLCLLPSVALSFLALRSSKLFEEQIAESTDNRVEVIIASEVPNYMSKSSSLKWRGCYRILLPDGQMYGGVVFLNEKSIPNGTKVKLRYTEGDRRGEIKILNEEYDKKTKKLKSLRNLAIIAGLIVYIEIILLG